MHDNLKHCVTVRELREELENFDDDTPVVFAYNYGDIGRTTVCQEVKTLDEASIEWSEYHRMFKLADDNQENPTSDLNVVVINL